MFGPDEEDKNESDKPVEEKEEEKKEEKKEDCAKKEDQGQPKVKEQDEVKVNGKKGKEINEKVGKKEVVKKKKEEKDAKSTEAEKGADAKESIVVKKVVDDQTKETSACAEEPMAVSDAEENLKETPVKTQTDTKNKDVGETNNESKKIKPSKGTASENDQGLDQAASDDIDNLLKIEQECATLQDLVAKQSETGSDVEQDVELEKEQEEEMEVDLDIDLQVKESEEKKKSEQVAEVKKIEPETVKLGTNDVKKDEEIKADETSVVVMDDLTAEDLDDEPLVIDESVKTGDELEAPGSIEDTSDSANDDIKDTKMSPLDVANVGVNESKDGVTTVEPASSAEKPKDATMTAEEMTKPEKLGQEKAEVTSQEVKQEEPKQKVETMSELIRTLTSDSEPVKAVNPLVIAPVHDTKKEEGSSAVPATSMQTITPLASLQAVLTATQKSLPTTTAADARLLQAGIQVNCNI